ncbi:MAG: alanine dehydrogenase [Saprospiraceae bacterium]|nr:alanine dehydrogenase [Saprospiraceae bacterium]
MSDAPKKVSIPKSLTEGQYSTQPETLEIQRKAEKMFIGIPKEMTHSENRIPLVPSSVKALVAYGHRVVIEQGAGKRSRYSDIDFSEKGAEIVSSREEVYKADVILRVAPPQLDEIELMRPNQVLISPLHLPMISSDYLYRLKEKRVIALAMEYIKDDDGTFPIVRIMSELAGLNSILTAAELLASPSGGKGILLGGISGVPPARIVILGAGVVAEFATRTALGLGAEVRVFDNNIYKLNRLQNLVGQRLFTSTIYTTHLEKELKRADVVIGAVHSKSGRTPILVTDEMVESMKPGSVIIDVSIDQGGCFATSEMTKLDHPTFVKYDVIHYCVPNIASRVPRTASVAVSNILTPLILKAASTGGIQGLLFSHQGLRHGVYSYKGSLTNAYLGERFHMKSTDLDLLLTSSL